jgi:hypothetical protein
MEIKADELISAVRWRLGLPTDGDPGRFDQICERFFGSSDAGQQQLVNRICRFLNDAIEQAVRQRLNIPVTGMTTVEDREFLNSLWNAIADWLQADPMRRSPRVSGLLRDAVHGKRAAAADARRSVPAPTRPAAAPAPSVANAPGSPNAPVANAPGSPSPNPNPPAEMSKPAGPQWLYRPVPDAEPDPHPEHDARQEMTPDESRLLAARVRGKKHKHEGTNCDDWFELGFSGRWTVVAVSDGAGSKKFSRVGAKASCLEAVRILTAELGLLHVSNRDSLADLTRRDANQAAFIDAEIEAVQQKMHQAFQGAFAAVERAFKERADNPAYAKLLGRRLAFEDLSGTLLVAAHTTVRVGGREQGLVVACQIGDGVVCALDPKGAIILLGAPDSGAYSGETDFLTTRRQLEPANLPKKTFAYAGPLRALLVMTDGVSDDYFPADPGMARLYADLVLNGILPPAVPVGEEALAEVSEHTPPNFDPADGRLDMEVEAVTAGGPQPVKLRSAEVYASELGRPVARVAASPAFLKAGAKDAPLGQLPLTPAEKLRLWLDAYTVRGSFDDRTLVVLHCERAS